MNWEFNFLYFLQTLHNPLLDKLMVEITHLGDAGVIWIIVSIFMLCTKKYRKCGLTMAISLIIMILLGNIALKNIFMRERPCWIDTSIALLIDNPHDYSFPSGHTYASIVAATAILLRHKWEGIIAMILAVLISFSRMYLFVHFPTDILTSVFLGIITAIIANILVNKYYDKLIQKFKRKEEL